MKKYELPGGRRKCTDGGSCIGYYPNNSDVLENISAIPFIGKLYFSLQSDGMDLSIPFSEIKKDGPDFDVARINYSSCIENALGVWSG